MRILFTSIFYLIIVTVAQTQNAFWDAIYLYNAKINTDLSQELQDKIAADDFLSNPFEAKPDSSLLIEIRAEFIVGDYKLESGSVIEPEQLSSLSTPTLIIDGTARFLAERFREEATVLYLNKFKEKLDALPLIETLLPKTDNYLQSANYFDVQSLGNNFKDAFEDDLQHLLIHLRDYVKADTLDGVTLAFSLDIANELINNTHPVDLLEYLDRTYKDKKYYDDYYSVIHLVNLLQLNLRTLNEEKPGTPKDPKGEKIWISISDLRLLNTPEEVQYFVAGIYHQDPVFLDSLGDKFKVFSSDLRKKPRELQKEWNKEIAPFLLALQRVENIIKKEEIKPDDYIQLLDAFVDIIELVNGKINKIDTEKLEILQRVIDVYQSIHKRNYSMLVSNGTWLIHKMLQEDDRFNDKDIVAIVAAIQKYGTFMVDVVNAKDSEDVKDAIKRNVTSFSYLDKRSSHLSFTFMGLPSLVGGTEQLTNSDNQVWKGSAGISCPVGFDFSYRRRKKAEAPSEFNPNYHVAKKTNNQNVYDNRKAVFGIFLGIADLGAPFSYRLDGTNTALPENISFKQILSPSASLYYSFPRSPVTLAFGWQHTPQLREIAGGTLENTQRWIGRVSWDIPLIKIGAKK